MSYVSEGVMVDELHTHNSHQTKMKYQQSLFKNEFALTRDFPRRPRYRVLTTQCMV